MESFEDRAYKLFGVHIGDKITLIKPIENGRDIKRSKAKIIRFHPNLKFVLVRYTKTGLSECFDPVSFMEAKGKLVR